MSFKGNSPMTNSITPSSPYIGEQRPTMEAFNRKDNVEKVTSIEHLPSKPSEDMEKASMTITTTILPSSIESAQSLTTNELENATFVDTTSKPTTIPNKTTTSLPVRYGIAAAIPYDDEFDLQTVLSAKSSIPFANHSNNDLLQFLQNEKSKKILPNDSSINDLLKENSRERNKLVQVARKAQQDFLDAIQLD